MKVSFLSKSSPKRVFPSPRRALSLIMGRGEGVESFSTYVENPGSRQSVARHVEVRQRLALRERGHGVCISEGVLRDIQRVQGREA